jgi:hypothetical protein
MQSNYVPLTGGRGGTGARESLFVSFLFYLTTLYSLQALYIASNEKTESLINAAPKYIEDT